MTAVRKSPSGVGDAAAPASIPAVLNNGANAYNILSGANQDVAELTVALPSRERGDTLHTILEYLLAIAVAADATLTWNRVFTPAGGGPVVTTALRTQAIAGAPGAIIVPVVLRDDFELTEDGQASYVLNIAAAGGGAVTIAGTQAVMVKAEDYFVERPGL